MTSQGHPCTRFRRVLERRSVILAWAAAAELGHVTLEDALALCLLVRDKGSAALSARGGALAGPLLRRGAGGRAR